MFKFTNNSWRYDRKCEWVFFSVHSEDVIENVAVTAPLAVYLPVDDLTNIHDQEKMPPKDRSIENVLEQKVEERKL